MCVYVQRCVSVYVCVCVHEGEREYKSSVATNVSYKDHE